MQFIFLKGGSVAFARDDAEQATWTQEELSVNAVFPYLPDKSIERGMQIVFEYLGVYQAFEIRSSKLVMGDSYQQIRAESIAISELTDCHIASEEELTNITAAAALQKAITGTGWNVGTDTSSGTSSGDFRRGSAWQCVSEVKENWNVIITPRVTVSDTGITGRYLDISKHGESWRGLRLSIDKNLTDVSVTYDDSDLYTALYGYGATESNDSGTSEVTFAGQVWEKTNDHPAKPRGQKYLEYPEMTALYGRNGQPRFGYYQNTDITSPSVLLQKTWDYLKTVCQPKISISGTLTDLSRLGYADEPIQLHDTVVVEVRPAGILLQREVIQLTVDLLDPANTTPTIGDYIPNIIYINRNTNNSATGEKGGASGGRGSRRDKEDSEFRARIENDGRTIKILTEQVDENSDTLRAAGIKVDPITGVLIYNEDIENGIGSRFKAQSQLIAAEVNERKAEDKELSSQIKIQKDKISLVVKETSSGYVVNSASIVMGINSQTGSYIKLQADKIDLTGYVTVSQLKATNAQIDNLITGNTVFKNLVGTKGSFYSLYLGGSQLSRNTYTINGTRYQLVTWYG